MAEESKEVEQGAELCDYIADAGLQLKQNGNVAQTMGNCIKALGFDKETRRMFRYNEMSGMIEVHGAWWNREQSPNITDSDVNFIRLFLEQKYNLSGEKAIPRAIDCIARQNRYHPVREYLKSLEYDGGKYIETLFPRFLGCEKSEYTTEATKLLMLGAIHRVFYPGCKFEVVVCLVEPKQGGGKSTMVRLLAHDDNWFTDELKDLDGENAYRYIQGKWLIEFSEMLATANSKSVEGIKQFISRQKDTYKIPYEKFPKDYPRQCVFIGTTNNIAFLPSDKTGNRRFIPLVVRSDMAELHPVEHEKEAREHIEKAWAEAMHYFEKNDYTLTFPKHLQKSLDEMRRMFEPEDPKVGIIQEWLDNYEEDTVCTSIIYHEALEKYDEPKRYELTAIAQIMDTNIAGWERHKSDSQKRKFKKYGVQIAWDRLISPVGDDGFLNISVQEELPFL
ncbi:virulence-associated protein E [Roseburia hominis]|uniref:VapE domain-containing protein n=1 Tax=Roseburia hominis TaxID=301301 RepID=UPI002017B813|nr:virulence-associated protein E [Roseburia hominis]